MNQLASMGSMGIWLGIVTAVLFAVCLYFILTYFEHLKEGDSRLIRQSKLFAVISLVLALLIPALFQLYQLNRIMNFNKLIE
jgi:heme/copper-type cytochrome/quinol oxidase subunit 4